jgi:thermitase
MKKPPAIIIFLSLLLLVILVREGAIFFNLSSSKISEEDPWFKQRPFCVNASDNLSEPIYNFAYNGNYVELVIGLRYEKKGYQELTSVVIQKNGYITNQLSLSGKTRKIVVSVPTNKISNFLTNILDNKNVEYVEPNWKFYIDTTPNDPKWTNQWGPAKIEANIAWDTQKGDSTILVAVVDTGIYYDHSDLAENYVPLGYDWVNDDSDPDDDHGHGTHCAGIIAATINNSLGISGIAQARIMAEKGFSSNGIGYEDDLANAIIHATDQGANIISCSWGGSTDSQLIHDAVEYATNAGALVIAAAGNTGTKEKIYPAAYPEVIAVTATNKNDKPASFTTYGDWVDLAAPGTNIYSTYLRNNYRSLSGTSMACPHVAGVAALVWSQYPTMNNEQVRSQLIYTADDLGAAGFDIYYGYGRVNARKAVAQTISLTGSKIINAPANTIYFLHINPSQSATAETAYDAIASGIIYGLTTNPQQQSFTSTNHLILETGVLNTSIITNATVVLLGGPCPQKTVEYYENAGITPLKFAANTTHYMFTTQTNLTVAALNKTTANSGHEDMCLIEVFMNKTNLILIMYGFTWKGTWAGGIYFKEVISKNLNDYAENSCYVFHWIDDVTQDGIPQRNEIQQKYPTP